MLAQVPVITVLFLLLNLSLRAGGGQSQHGEDSVQYLIRQASVKLEPRGDHLAAARAYLKAASLLGDGVPVDSTFELRSLALNASRKSRSAEYMMLSFEAVSKSLRSLYRKVEASQTMDSAIHYARVWGDSAQLARLIGRRAILLDDEGLSKKALDEYRIALDIYRKLGDSVEVATICHNMALSMGTDDPRTEDYYLRAIDLSREYEHCNSCGIYMYNYADHLYSSGRSDEALVALDSSDRYRERNDENRGRIYNAFLKFVIYQGLGMDAKALENLMDGYTRAKALGNVFVLGTVSSKVFPILMDEGRYKEAMEAAGYYMALLEKQVEDDGSHVLIESLYREKYESQRAMDSLHIQSEEAAHHLEIIKLRASLLEQTNLRNVLLAVLAGVLLVAFVLWWAMRKLRVKQQRIDVQNKVLKKRQKEFSESLRYAQRLQATVMPSRGLVRDYLTDSFIFFRPKELVAGDFYWMQSERQGLGETEVWFAVADSTGHGVPGAMVGVSCAQALNSAYKDFGKRDPAEILEYARKLVIDVHAEEGSSMSEGMEVGLCRLNVLENIVSFAGARQSMWVVTRGEVEVCDQDEEGIVPVITTTKRRHGVQVVEIPGSRQPIAQYPMMRSFEEVKLRLNTGDMIYLFTDGFVDQFGGQESEQGKKFKYEAFRDLLALIHDEETAMQEAILTRTFEDWKGDLEQVDDVCVIGVRV